MDDAVMLWKNHVVALPNCCVEVVFVQAEGQSALTDGGYSRWHNWI